MTTNLRETLLAMANRRYKSVDVNGTQFWLQSLTEAERSYQELVAIDRKSGKVDYARLPEAKLRMLCLCLVDGEGGERMFADDEWGQLSALDSAVIAKLYAACLSLNGYETDEVKEMVGN